VLWVEVIGGNWLWEGVIGWLTKEGYTEKSRILDESGMSDVQFGGGEV
jgi:hypothetical protein